MKNIILLAVLLFHSCSAWRAPFGVTLKDIPEVLREYKFPIGSRYAIETSTAEKIYAVTLSDDYKFKDLNLRKGTMVVTKHDGRIYLLYSDDAQEYRGVIYPKESILCISKDLTLRVPPKVHDCAK